MTEKEEKTLEKFGKFVQEGHASNELLVEIVELAGGFLNLKTISDYARQAGISYQGAKKCRQVIYIFNVKFIIDNE